MVDILNSDDDSLYGTRCFGTSFSFAKAAAPSSYMLRLHFAETYWTRAGQRIFDVGGEGQPLLTNFDLVASVGAKKATTKEFNVSITDGKLDLMFTSLVDNAIISAIELILNP